MKISALVIGLVLVASIAMADAAHETPVEQFALASAPSDSSATAPKTHCDVMTPKDASWSLTTCAIRHEDRMTVVLSPESSAAPTQVSDFDPDAMPDGCEVELSLLPTGHVLETWPCDRSKKRLAVSMSRDDRVWLLRPHGFVIQRVDGIDFPEGTLVRPIRSWAALFPDEPGPSESDWMDTLTVYDARNGTSDPNMPQAVNKVPPDYPDEARASGRGGLIVVYALVDRYGRVTVTLAKNSSPPFTAAAIDAVRQWTFRPARRDGKAVAAWVAVPVKWTLD